MKEDPLMQDRKLVPVALVLLLMVAWLAAPSRAAELAGPNTEAAPSACSPAAATFSLPSSLASTDFVLAADPTLTCGCGDSGCLGKSVGSSCPSETPLHSNFCFDTGLCLLTPGRQCACRPAP